jgi:site-specific DNA recombinase
MQRFMKLEDLTPEMLHRLVEKIKVKADGTLQIHYRFTPPSALFRKAI